MNSEQVTQITEQLIDLRKQTESTDMSKAALFSDVKATEGYKEKYGTFGAFCEHVGYHRTYVYAILRAYSNPVVCAVYSDIGALAAQTIAKADKVLPQAQIVELCELAKEHNSSVVLREVKKRKAQAQASATPEATEQKEPSTRDLLEEKSGLLARKSDLALELAEIDNRLAVLEKQISEHVEAPQRKPEDAVARHASEVCDAYENMEQA
jgi:hypothetical protein